MAKLPNQKLKGKSPGIKKKVHTKASKSDRNIFSVRTAARKHPKVFSVLDNGKEREVFDPEDAQMSEIRKITLQTIKAKKKLIAVKNVKRQERVNYDTMVSGTVVACKVTHVFTDRLYVSLPFKMRGYIPLTHISEHYTKLMHQVANGETTTETPMTLPQLYSPGQWLIAAVANSPLNIKPKSGLMLSLYPTDVNSTNISAKMLKSGTVLQCSVVSVEDHGYTLDCGVRDISAAFLPARELSQEMAVGVGSVLTCVVTVVGGVAASKTLTLTADPIKVKTATSVVSELNVGATQPGMTVQGVVTVSSTEGLTLHIGSEEEYYDLMECETSDLQWKVGLVSRVHLRSPFDQSHFFRPGQKVLAKVLFATNFPKTVYLTLNKSTFNHDSKEAFDPMNGLEFSKEVEGTVFDCNDEGVTLKLGHNNAGFCFAYMAMDRGTENKISIVEMKERYPVGRRISCKPIAYNWIDNQHIVVFNFSGENRIDKMIAEIRPGQVMVVTVTAHVDSGIKVITGTGVPAFVRKSHIDVEDNEDVEQKLKVGKKFKARVLNITSAAAGLVKQNSSVYLSMRRSIVMNSNLIISECSDNYLGKDAVGIVKKVLGSLMFIELGIGICAILHARTLPHRIDLTEKYSYGEVINVKLISLEKNPNREGLRYIVTLPTSDIPTDTKSAKFVVAEKSKIGEKNTPTKAKKRIVSVTKSVTGAKKKKVLNGKSPVVETKTKMDVTDQTSLSIAKKKKKAAIDNKKSKVSAKAKNMTAKK